ncbi:MAG: hypothetical protein KIS66_05730 [Fimbriimonadaceae bacterium]|nr:hypothetical protein [Fimbriimonadaceae bacterium]
MRTVAASLILLGCANLGSAQSGLAGRDQFPQFRGLTGLSGSGFAVGEDGRPGGRGPMAISTPIGHTLGKWSAVAGGAVVSPDRRFNARFPGRSAYGNGNGFLLLGADLGRHGNLAATCDFLSSYSDTAWHLQYSPVLKGPVQVAVGVLDLTGNGGSSGQDLPGDERSSRSFFGVATVKVRDGAYVSLGTGTRRYQKGFGNASLDLAKSLQAVVEHDGFGWNYGLAFRPFGDQGPVVEGRRVKVTAFLGLVQSRYATWSVVIGY